jgi:hypothetical protein
LEGDKVKSRIQSNEHAGRLEEDMVILRKLPGEAILFSINDRLISEALQLYREEVCK